MKVGYLQCAPHLGDQAATTRMIEALLPADTDVDLLVLPELCNSGYNFTSVEHARNLAESARDGEWVRFIATLCRRFDCHIVTGLNERDGDRLYNTAVMVGPNGPVGTYRKIHLFLNEFDIFTPGDSGVPVFDVGGVRIAMLICFDWCFPEIWRVAALKGSDIICHPSCLVLPGRAQRGVPINAMINGVFVVTANRTGREGNLSFTGNSMIVDPDGEMLRLAGAEGDELGICEIDPASARDKSITARNDRLADRRPETYTRLVDPEIGA